LGEDEKRNPVATAVTDVAFAGMVAVLLLVVAVPDILGVSITWLIPEIGQQRAGLTALPWLHFLWIIPVIYLVSVFLTPIAKLIGRIAGSELLGKVLDQVLEFLLVTVPFRVFFATWSGAAVAAAISTVLSLIIEHVPAVKRFLESQTAPTS
jgi:hypothetical protein